ncbi:bile acid:sodium symporter family protein [Actinomycetospora straminea]|uniref:bile acid:sodium symporter family protein n=1 Tax=Actinomycetospora straminea TaxID=663607 RepID=UPI002365419D|nr:hypothetical protein [Actinomycetospora straminea]MDD7934364.1 hypothetical protein [Actinomycetospora straminea]
MDTALVTVGLPLALAVVMFGLGLSLTVGDFARIGREPRAVAVALVTQIVLLPAVAVALVLALGLAPVLAVGMLLLAASPGGTTANLFSHLFRGDVALNITLTAVNSVLAGVTHWPRGSRCRGCSASGTGRRWPRRSRSVSTTARWRSRWRSRCSATSGSRCRRRCTA